MIKLNFNFNKEKLCLYVIIIQIYIYVTSKIRFVDMRQCRHCSGNADIVQQATRHYPLADFTRNIYMKK